MKANILAVFGVLAVIAGSAVAQEADIETVCAARTCRTGNIETVILGDKGRYLPVSIPRSPYVLDDGSLLLFPGETLAFQFTVEDGKLGPAKFLARYAPEMRTKIVVKGKLADDPDTATLPKAVFERLPPNTVLFSYGQARDTPGMVLQVVHNLPATFKYDAVMMVIEGDSYREVPTSTCPALPRLIGFESWPHPIGPLMLGQPRLLPADAGTDCK